MHHLDHSAHRRHHRLEAENSGPVHEHIGLEALKLLDKSSIKPGPHDDWAPGSVRDTSGKKVYASWAVEILDGGTYTAKSGDGLWQVARRTLGVTGHPDATDSEIKNEVKRITELNKDEFPELARKGGILREGTTLKIFPEKMQTANADGTFSDKPDSKIATSPSTSTADKVAATSSDQPGCAPRERREVHGALVFADKCDKLEIGQDGVAIVRPGADVVVNHGGRAFAFGGKVTAMAGSRVLFAGGEIEAQPESQVKYIDTLKPQPLNVDRPRPELVTNSSDKRNLQVAGNYLPDLELH